MKKSLSVTVLVDSATLPIGDTRDPYYKKQSTEYHIVKVLSEMGHRVSTLGIGDMVEPVIGELHEQKPDVVFNLTETFRNNRRYDKDIAGLLDLLGIPFTGAGSTGLMLSRNKAVCKQILSTMEIPVPKYFTIQPGKKIQKPDTVPFPLVVKPLFEDGSAGISNASLVTNREEMCSRAQWVHETFQQPAIIEEFIEGRELYCTVIGNKRLKVLPLRELKFDCNDTKGPVLATSRVKWNENYQKKWNIVFGFAENIEDRTVQRIANTCKKIYKLLYIRDYGRIDLKLTKDNSICIIEANGNPNLHYFDEVAESARRANVSFPQLIHTILFSALKRKTTEP